MVERLKGFRFGEQVFATRAEAERAEGLSDLIAWFQNALVAASDGGAAPSIVAPRLARSICDKDPARFVSLLRKAGVPLIVRERKANVDPDILRWRPAPKRPSKRPSKQADAE
jgi:hypothetical protein